MTIQRRHTSLATAIPIAFSDLGPIRDGDTLKFPAGRFVLGDADVLTIDKQYVTIEGAGPGKTTLTKAHGGFFSIGAVTGATITGMTLENTAPVAGEYAIDASGAARLHFEDLMLKNVANGWRLRDACNLVDMDDCHGTFADLSGYAVVVAKANGVYSDNCDFTQIETGGPPGSNATGGGCFAVYECDTLKITRLLAQRFYYGLVANAAGPVVQNVWLNNAVFDACRKQGLYLLTTHANAFLTRFQISDTWVQSTEASAVECHQVAGAMRSLAFDNLRTVKTYHHGAWLRGGLRGVRFSTPDIVSVAGVGSGCGVLNEGGDDIEFTGGVVGAQDPTIAGYAAQYGFKSTSALTDYRPNGTKFVGTIANTSLV